AEKFSYQQSDCSRLARGLRQEGGGPGREGTGRGTCCGTRRCAGHCCCTRTCSRCGRRRDGRQDRPRGPRLRCPGPLRQGQRERRADGHRGPERARRHHRRQEDQVRDPGRRRRRRSEAGHRCRAEAVRRQGRGRGGPPELRHHHPGFEGLQRLRHSARHRRGHQPQPDQARLQDHLPHHRQRQRAGRRAGAVRGRHAEAQEGGPGGRPHGLRPGRDRGLQEDRAGPRHA
ncbi:MAG: ABC-type branched-chain amino acid transport systems, periplasmic component, partial [uncultured Ramlibacter sp.]